MKTLLIFILAGLLQFAFPLEFCGFLDDIFRYKNVKSVVFMACTTKHADLAYTWRKSAKAPISVLLARKISSLSSQFGQYEDETVGFVMNKACNISLVLPVIADTLKTKTLIVIWSDDGSRFEETLSAAEPRNALDTFYAVIDDGKVLVYNRKMNLVMTWSADTGLTDLGYTDRQALSGKRVKGMVSTGNLGFIDVGIVGNLRGLTVPSMFQLIYRRFTGTDLRQILSEKNETTQTDNLMKFSFVLNQFLEKIYNFRWDIHLSEPQASGEVYATVNGSLNYSLIEGGQFEALKTGKIDVGMFPAEQLPAGLDFMEFLLPLTTFRQFFVFSSPISYLEPHIVYSQFSGPVWGLSVVLAILVAVVSSVSAKAIVIHNEEDAEELTFATNVLNVVGAVAQQGLERTTSKLSVRLAHFFLLFLTLMLFMFYNTGLLMYTLNPSQKEIRSFGELLQRGFSVAAEDTRYNKFQLEGNYSHPDEWFYQNCRDGSCRTEVEFLNLSAGAAKVKNERTAFFGYGPNIYEALEEVMTDRELSDLKEVVVHKPYLVSTFVRKHFPYKEFFSRGLLLLKEAGITYHEDQTWNSKKPDPLIESYFVVASLYSTSVAFILLFVGIFASLLLFALEIFSRRESLAARIEKTSWKLARRQLISRA